MITICNIIFIRYTFDNSEIIFQSFSKFICCGFHRSAIERIVDIFSGFPFCTHIIHFLHNRNRKWPTYFSFSMRNSCHVSYTFIQSSISKRNSRISFVQKFINCFSFIKASNSSILPKNRSYIRRCTKKAFMTKSKSTMT